MRIITRYPLLALAVSVFAVAGVGTPAALALPLNPGDVFAAVNNGRVQHYDHNGNLLETLNTGRGGYTTGMAFDSSGNLYVTNFSNGSLTRFAQATGSIIAPNPFVSPGGIPESIVFDQGGNFFVSDVGGGGIRKYNAAGTLQTNFNNVGRTDWIDLAGDQRTLYFTTEGRFVGRYDTVTRTVLSNFANLPGAGEAYAFRILGDGGVLVADGDNVKRLNSSGTVVQTYSVAGENSWFALNLDPNGTTFWSGDFSSGKFYEFDINTGQLLLTVNTNTGNYNLFGLTIAGEETQGTVTPEPGSMVIAAVSVLGLLGYGWRRRVKMA
jgi:streptogramin lyase